MIILLRITLDLIWFTSDLFLPTQDVKNTTYGPTDMIIYSCLVSENCKQLQRGNSSIFLISRWEFHPRQKNFRNSRLRRRVPWNGWSREKNIQTKSFIPKIICDNEKHLPSTKYVTITLPQKLCEKNFWAIIFWTCPPVFQETVR